MSCPHLDFNDIYVEVTGIECMHKRHKFEYDSRGLSQSGHHFKQDLSYYLPEFFKNGKVKKSTVLSAQPVKFWRAQCLFRGLHHSGTVEELQLRLSKSDDIMSLDLA